MSVEQLVNKEREVIISHIPDEIEIEKNHYSDSDSDSEEEEFTSFRVIPVKEVRIMIAGGGLGNGNHSAYVICSKEVGQCCWGVDKYEEKGSNPITKWFNDDDSKWIIIASGKYVNGDSLMEHLENQGSFKVVNAEKYGGRCIVEFDSLCDKYIEYMTEYNW